jgi:hypothetical protein
MRVYADMMSDAPRQPRFGRVRLLPADVDAAARQDIAQRLVAPGSETLRSQSEEARGSGSGESR